MIRMNEAGEVHPFSSMVKVTTVMTMMMTMIMTIVNLGIITSVSLSASGSTPPFLHLRTG